MGVANTRGGMAPAMIAAREPVNRGCDQRWEQPAPVSVLHANPETPDVELIGDRQASSSRMIRSKLARHLSPFGNVTRRPTSPRTMRSP